MIGTCFHVSLYALSYFVEIWEFENIAISLFFQIQGNTLTNQPDMEVLILLKPSLGMYLLRACLYSFILVYMTFFNSPNFPKRLSPVSSQELFVLVSIVFLHL